MEAVAASDAYDEVLSTIDVPAAEAFAEQAAAAAEAASLGADVAAAAAATAVEAAAEVRAVATQKAVVEAKARAEEAAGPLMRKKKAESDIEEARSALHVVREKSVSDVKEREAEVRIASSDVQKLTHSSSH